MNNNYDVIIIGAGPGGLACAKTLKNTNLHILVIDNSKPFGDKICAGGLVHLPTDINLPLESYRTFKTQNVHLKDHLYNIDLNNPIKITDRTTLAKYLLKQVSNSTNIDFIWETKVTEINKGSITTEFGEKYQYEKLIGADGSSSIVRKFLKLPSKICIGMYYEIDRIEQEMEWYVDPQNLISGYVWVFPHHNHVNVGLYYNPLVIKANKAQPYFQKFLKERGYDIRDRELKAFPINYNYCGYEFDNVFLVGDAAGWASRLSGEGIAYAIISGREVAHQVLSPNYKSNILRKLLNRKHRSNALLELYERNPKFQESFLNLGLRTLELKLLKN